MRKFPLAFLAFTVCMLLFALSPNAKALMQPDINTLTSISTTLTTILTTGLYTSSYSTSLLQSVTVTPSTTTALTTVTTSGSIAYSPSFTIGLAFIGLLMIGLPLAILLLTRTVLAYAVMVMIMSITAVYLLSFAWWLSATNIFMCLVVIIMFKESPGVSEQ